MVGARGRGQFHHAFRRCVGSVFRRTVMNVRCPARAGARHLPTLPRSRLHWPISCHSSAARCRRPSLAAAARVARRSFRLTTVVLFSSCTRLTRFTNIACALSDSFRYLADSAIICSIQVSK